MASSNKKLVDRELDEKIERLLADTQFDGHPLREALVELLARFAEQSAQIERIASISDGYQTMLRERNETLAERNQRNLRQLQKIVRISDHYQRMLHDLNDSLKVRASQDALTGLPNRRSMSERLEATVALAARSASSFSIVVLDIDHFKTINDSFGHQIGDLALLSIAQVLNESLRVYDMAARWGGEEFLLLFPETNAQSAVEVAGRIRQSIENSLLDTGEKSIKVTASFGVAQHEKGETGHQTLARADRALYRAKGTGRNRVVLFDRVLDRNVE